MIRSKNPCPVCGGVHWLPLAAPEIEPSTEYGEIEIDRYADESVTDDAYGAVPDMVGDLCLRCGTVVS